MIVKVLRHPKDAFIIKWNPRKSELTYWRDLAFGKGRVTDVRAGKKVAVLSTWVTRRHGGKTYRFRRVIRVTERIVEAKGQMLMRPGLELEGWWTSLSKVIPEAFWQRTYVHFLRHAADHLPRKAIDDCLQELRWIYDRRDLGEARSDLTKWLGKCSEKYPIFPDRESCLRLIRESAAGTHEGWLEANRYLNMDLLKEHKKLRLSLAVRWSRRFGPPSDKSRLDPFSAALRGSIRYATITKNRMPRPICRT